MRKYYFFSAAKVNKKIENNAAPPQRATIKDNT